ncbi:MAG: ATP synthase F1 subunit gamma [Proteobacteria bacterium]|nr:MAG: ATP synthase F1 subunit gamma [Pseudomonadota bacterium]PIE19624.1 MAG: ATP synthase F1 subunit gamma [Pseudomonadota bacterium]
MPSLKDIRRRITSVKSTQKITRAMKLVAAAKLRKAQENIMQARPYANELRTMISELALRTEQHDHPLLTIREPRRVMLLILTSDRGLCGAFNTNVLREGQSYLAQHKDDHEEMQLAVLGKKGREYLEFRNIEIKQYFPGLDVGNALERSQEMSAKVIDGFLGEDLDKVFVLYNEFKSAMSQRIVVEQLLPIEPMMLSGQDKSAQEGVGEGIGEFAFEPDKDTILENILPMYVQVELYRAALESTASEYGARMTSMENATNSANDMIATLTLQYNKARQAAITTELGEIVGGAEAMKG